jgi:hypothetical protein
LLLAFGYLAFAIEVPGRVDESLRDVGVVFLKVIEDVVCGDNVGFAA